MAYRIIPGFEKYVFFDDGRIWSRSRGHFLKPSINRMGYPQIPFAITGTKKRKSQLFHILIATAFVHNPKPEEYDIVNHIDNDPTNCHYLNLEWCTQGHNIKHAYKTGRRKWTGGNSKLKTWQVKAIRLLSDYKINTHDQMAEAFGVTKSCIRDVASRLHFKTVPEFQPIADSVCLISR